MDRAKKRLYSIFIIVAICILCVFLFFAVFSQYLNKVNYTKEMESKIYFANKSYANQFNEVLDNLQTRVNALAIGIGEFVSYRDYREGTKDFFADKKRIHRIVKKILKKEAGISSLYVTFHPKLFPNRQEVWYIRDNNGQVTWVDSAKMAKTWLLESNPNTTYFYSAIENGSYWGGMEWETILKRYCITYTHAITDQNGTVIGIAGSDIKSTNITQTVETMKLDRDCSSYLFDAKGECIAKSQNAVTEGDVFDKIKEQSMEGQKASEVSYAETKRHGRLILSSSQLINGWHLVFAEPEDAALASFNTAVILVCILAVIALLLLILLNVFLFRKSLKPMIDKVEDQEAFLIIQSRQARIGEMLGNTIHQIKQPINSANIILSNMRDDIGPDTADEKTLLSHVEQLQKSMDAICPIISDFTEFLKPDDKKSAIPIYREFARAQSLMEAQLKLSQIYPAVYIPKDLFIWGFPNEFSQCVLSLMTNAVEAMNESGGEKRMIATAAESGGIMYFSLFNMGRNIPEQVGHNIFKPYFTTKKERGGSGVGLYLVHQIVTEHFKGTIDYHNTAQGVKFNIKIPSYQRKGGEGDGAIGSDGSVY